MTLDDFNQLCRDQWARPEHGDVMKLWLTDESTAELSASIGAAIAIGTHTGIIVNPVTRRAVIVSSGNPVNTAVINVGSHMPAELMTLQ